MNKRQVFFGYVVLTIVTVLLARNNLLNFVPLKMFQVNFGLVNGSSKLMLLNANLILFDLTSIILARSEANSMEILLKVRKVGFTLRLKAFKKYFCYYLILVILVHLFLFGGSNLIISWEMLVGLIVIWVILVGLPMYRLPIYLRVIIVFCSLIIFRLIA